MGQTTSSTEFAILHALPHGAAIFDAETLRILEFNSAFASMVSVAENCLNAICLPELLNEDSREWFSQDQLSLLDNRESFTGTLHPRFGCDNPTVHVTLIPPDSTRDQSAKSKVLVSLSSHSNFSDQDHAITAILDNTMAVIYSKDREGRYQLINRRFEQLFDISMGDIRGKTDFDVFPQEQATKFHQNDVAVMNNETAIEFEEVAPHEDGLHTYISLKFPVRNHRGAVIGVCGISTDITERRKLEDEIARISSREKNWISRELHDSVGQQLTGLAYLAKSLVKRNSDDDELCKLQATLLSGIQSALTETRRIVKGMSPVEFDSLGLRVALDELAVHIRTTFQIECEFSSDPQTHIHDNELALQWYRIAQEATNNAIKHARPSRIAISLRSDEHHLMMQIIDDGCGFSGDCNHGMGLRIMRHRSGMVDADLDISSSEGGTKVTCKAKK